MEKLRITKINNSLGNSVLPLDNNSTRSIKLMTKDPFELIRVYKDTRKKIPKKNC